MAGDELPGLAGRILTRLLDPSEARALASELAELRDARTARQGAAAASAWYRREVRRAARMLVSARLRSMAPVRSGAAPGEFEVRQAVRFLSRSPVLATVVAVTLGLGIGGTAAMWAVVDAVVLRPLPYEAQDRLALIYHAVRGNRWSLSVADWEAIRTQSARFERVGAARSGMLTVMLNGESERVSARAVTPGWYGVLGVAPVLGRPFVAADGEPGAAATVLLSHGFWQRRLGGDADVIGSVLDLDGVPHEVVGVLPASVGPLEERHEVFPALRLDAPTRKGPFFLTVIGRLAPGATLAGAAEELRAINERIFPVWQDSWQDRSATWGVMTVAEAVLEPVRAPLLALLAAVGFVLVVALLNSANLLLARAVERRRELAVRMALGASRARIARLLMTESALAASAGVALGLLLAFVALSAVTAAGPDLLPRSASITLLHARVLPPVLLLAVACVVFCGLVPAVQAAALSDPGRGLGESSRGVAGGRSAQRVRRGLVVAQFAIAAPLLAGAALLLNGFVRLQRVDVGFDPGGIVSAGVALPAERYGDGAARAALWRVLLERVSAIPGVESAGLSEGRPPRDHVGSNNFDLEDRPAPPGQSQPGSIWLTATPGYFQALDIPLVAGRMFDASDGPETPSVVLVDETWARTYYPGEDPLGRRFRSGGCTGPDCTISTVVGVVGDVKYTGLDDAGTGMVRGTVYELVWQVPPTAAYVSVRSARPAAALVNELRAVVRSLDPGLPLIGVATARALVDAALARPRNQALLASAFGTVALLLAVVGIYGVMAFFVHHQRREIGIRLALGAAPVMVVRGLVGRGMRPVAAGIAAGAVLAVAAAHLLAGLIYGVSVRDPATHAGVLILLAVTAALACLVPAARATRSRPLAILREE